MANKVVVAMAASIGLVLLGEATAEEWRPAPYPAHCSEGAKSYETLPVVNIVPNYTSPNEVVSNYRALTDDDGQERQDLGQALNAFGGALGYAKQLQTSYDKAALEFWDYFDRTGKSDTALEKEYGYWLWRRGRFQGEMAEIQGVAYQSGSGAASSLGNTLGSAFAVPFEVNNREEAIRYDYIKFSECTLEHAQTLDDAIKYEVILDQYPADPAYIDANFKRMGITELSEEEKEILLVAMRERRKTNVDYNGRPSTGLFGDKEAVRRVIARQANNRTAGHNAFIEFLEQAAKTNELSFSVELGAPKKSLPDQKYNQQAAGILFAYFKHPTKYAQDVLLELFPNGFVSAAECAPDKLTDAADFLYAEIGPLIDKAATERSYPTEFCVRSSTKLRGRRPPGMTWEQEGKACIGHDAWRLAMFSCATGQSVGADPDLNQALLYKYSKAASAEE